MRVRYKVMAIVLAILAAVISFVRYGEAQQGPLRLTGTLLPTFLVSHTVKVTVTNVSDQPVALDKCVHLTGTSSVSPFTKVIYGPCGRNPVTLKPGESITEVHSGKPEWLWMEQPPIVYVRYYAGAEDPVFFRTTLHPIWQIWD